MKTIYVKTALWRGEPKFYLGFTPSDPAADRCSQLGSYFLQLCTLEQAKTTARALARENVVVCDPIIGLR